MNNYQVSMLGLREIRWIQSGQVRLSTRETILYSGHEEEDVLRTEGVALMLTKEAQQALISWEAVSSRITTAKFRTKNTNIKVVQYYAPHKCCRGGEDEDF